jgi:hypothetical protein
MGMPGVYANRYICAGVGESRVSDCGLANVKRPATGDESPGGVAGRGTTDLRILCSKKCNGRRWISSLAYRVLILLFRRASLCLESSA